MGYIVDHVMTGSGNPGGRSWNSDTKQYDIDYGTPPSYQYWLYFYCDRCGSWNVEKTFDLGWLQTGLTCFAVLALLPLGVVIFWIIVATITGRLASFSIAPQILISVAFWVIIAAILYAIRKSITYAGFKCKNSICGHTWSYKELSNLDEIRRKNNPVGPHNPKGYTKESAPPGLKPLIKKAASW
jgi:hypothetical protein